MVGVVERLLRIDSDVKGLEKAQKALSRFQDEVQDTQSSTSGLAASTQTLESRIDSVARSSAKAQGSFAALDAQMATTAATQQGLQAALDDTANDLDDFQDVIDAVRGEYDNLSDVAEEFSTQTSLSDSLKADPNELKIDEVSRRIKADLIDQVEEADEKFSELTLSDPDVPDPDDVADGSPFLDPDTFDDQRREIEAGLNQLFEAESAGGFETGGQSILARMLKPDGQPGADIRELLLGGDDDTPRQLAEMVQLLEDLENTGINVAEVFEEVTESINLRAAEFPESGQDYMVELFEIIDDARLGDQSFPKLSLRNMGVPEEQISDDLAEDPLRGFLFNAFFGGDESFGNTLREVDQDLLDFVDVEEARGAVVRNVLEEADLEMFSLHKAARNVSGGELTALTDVLQTEEGDSLVELLEGSGIDSLKNLQAASDEELLDVITQGGEDQRAVTQLLSRASENLGGQQGGRAQSLLRRVEDEGGFPEDAQQAVANILRNAIYQDLFVAAERGAFPVSPQQALASGEISRGAVRDAFEGGITDVLPTGRKFDEVTPSSVRDALARSDIEALQSNREARGIIEAILEIIAAEPALGQALVPEGTRTESPTAGGVIQSLTLRDQPESGQTELGDFIGAPLEEARQELLSGELPALGEGDTETDVAPATQVALAEYLDAIEEEVVQEVLIERLDDVAADMDASVADNFADLRTKIKEFVDLDIDERRLEAEGLELGDLPESLNQTISEIAEEGLADEEAETLARLSTRLSPELIEGVDPEKIRSGMSEFEYRMGLVQEIADAPPDSPREQTAQRLLTLFEADFLNAPAFINRPRGRSSIETDLRTALPEDIAAQYRGDLVDDLIGTMLNFDVPGESESRPLRMDEILGPDSPVSIQDLTRQAMDADQLDQIDDTVGLSNINEAVRDVLLAQQNLAGSQLAPGLMAGMSEAGDDRGLLPLFAGQMDEDFTGDFLSRAQQYSEAVTDVTETVNEAQDRNIARAGADLGQLSQIPFVGDRIPGTERHRQRRGLLGGMLGGLGAIADADEDSSLLAQFLSPQETGLSLERHRRRLHALADTYDSMVPLLEIASLNVGSLNLQFSSMAAMVFKLSATLGPLVSSVAALAGSFGVAAVSAGSFVAVGALEYLDNMADEMAGVSNRTEAAGELFNTLGQAAEQAVEPIAQAQLGGTGPTAAGLFEDSLRGGLVLLREFANGVARLAELPVVLEQTQRLSNIMFGGRGDDTFISNMETVLQNMLPVLVDIAAAIVSGFGPALARASEQAADLIPTLMATIDNLGPAFGLAVQYGTGFIEMLLYAVQAVAMMINVAATLFDVLTTLLLPLELLGINSDTAARNLGRLIGIMTVASKISALVGTRVGLLIGGLSSLAKYSDTAKNAVHAYAVAQRQGTIASLKLHGAIGLLSAGIATLAIVRFAEAIESGETLEAVLYGLVAGVSTLVATLSVLNSLQALGIIQTAGFSAALQGASASVLSYTTAVTIAKAATLVFAKALAAVGVGFGIFTIFEALKGDLTEIENLLQLAAGAALTFGSALAMAGATGGLAGLVGGAGVAAGAKSLLAGVGATAGGLGLGATVGGLGGALSGATTAVSGATLTGAAVAGGKAVGVLSALDAARTLITGDEMLASQAGIPGFGFASDKLIGARQTAGGFINSLFGGGSNSQPNTVARNDTNGGRRPSEGRKVEVHIENNGHIGERDLDRKIERTLARRQKDQLKDLL